MDENNIQTIVYLEGKIKELTRKLADIRELKLLGDADLRSERNICGSLKETNERLLKTIEKSFESLKEKKL